MNARILLPIAALVLAACAQSPSEQLADETETVAAGEEIVCVREQITGSKMTRKVCTTRAERDRIASMTESTNEQRRDRGASPGLIRGSIASESQ